MQVQINGQNKEISDNLNLKQLVEQFSDASVRIITEINETIIKKDFWDTTPVREGDTIELVTFVGGG